MIERSEPGTGGDAQPAGDANERTVRTRFGELAYRDDAVLHFPSGLPGFPAHRRFVFAEVPGAGRAFQFLHALDDEPIDLVVVPLERMSERVDAQDVDAVRESLGIAAEDLVVLCVVTLPPRGSGLDAKVNLRAPIFVDIARRTAVQAVLANTAYRFREPLRAA